MRMSVNTVLASRATRGAARGTAAAHATRPCAQAAGTPLARRSDPAGRQNAEKHLAAPRAIPDRGPGQKLISTPAMIERGLPGRGPWGSRETMYCSSVTLWIFTKTLEVGVRS